MSGAKSSDMDVGAEAPSSMERQTVTKTIQNQEKWRRERWTKGTLGSSMYKIFYTKEHQGTCWKLQHTNIQERTMRVKAHRQRKRNQLHPKKQQTWANGCESKSEQPEQLWSKCRHTPQPPYPQEMLQQILNLQQNMKEVQKYTEDLSNDRDVNILTEHVHNW